MKRIYIAVLLIAASLFLGYLSGKDVEKRSNKHLEYISNMEYLIKRNEYKKAERLCKKAENEFNKTDIKFMYTYYVHSDLSDISENLASMRDYIKRKKDTEYFYVSGIAKNRLLKLINKEPINLQNIL
jgi:hypothetical protein